MIRSLKALVVGVALTLTVFGLLGCGSGSSNDQGVSFTLLGFYDDLEGDPELVRVVPLSFSGSEIQGDQFQDGFTDQTNISGAIISFAGSQNNLSQVFIRTDAAYLSYFIPGASRQPPDTATAYSLVLGPAVSAGAAASDDPFISTLPPALADVENVGYAPVSIVPADVMTWLNLNRTALPELPFDMIVTAYVSGVTSAGDRLDSNEVQYLVKFTPDNVIPPASGAAEGGDNPSDSSGGAGADAGATDAGA